MAFVQVADQDIEAMAIHRLNHAVLYVRDADASADFYEDLLGFRRVVELPGAVFLQAAESTNDHDLGLFSIGDGARPSPAGRGGAVGLYHLAWEVDTLRDLQDARERLARAGVLEGMTDHGTTKALYARDPDGIHFEVSWLVPADLLGGVDGMVMQPLDLDAEIERYGADTRGGVGVSRLVPSA